MQTLILLTSTLCWVPFLVAAPQDDSSLAAEWKSSEGIPTKGPRVEVNHQNEIAVDVPGTLIKLSPSARGGFVEKGQLVAEIDSSVAQAELDELQFKAESTVLIDFAKVSLEQEIHRLKDMKDRNATAGSPVFKENEIREQELAVKKGEAEVNKSLEDQKSAVKTANIKRVQLEQYKKFAGISGIVTDLHNKSEGTSVRQGDPIMTIVDFEKMIVKMDVHPIYETRVKVGDRVLVRRKIGGEDSAQDTGGKTGFFNESRSQPIKTGVQDNSGAEYFFEGVVTFTSSQAKADDDNSFEVEAVVNNQSVGVGNYLLKEGVRIDARILSR